MSDFQLSDAQGEVVEILTLLIGLSGVHKRPEQDDAIVLDLLPGSHVAFGGDPFCVKVDRDGVMHMISDEEAGLDKRPTPMEAMMEQNKELVTRIQKKYE